MMERRRSEIMSSMTPYWRASFKTVPLEEVEYGRFDAFVMESGPRGSPFIGYDLSRPRPIAHDEGKPLSGTKAGGGAFDGRAVLDTITDSRNVVVSGLPAGFKLSAGDYVEFRMTLLTRSLHRITADATANSSGVVSLRIMFGLDTQNFNTAAVVDFEKPATVMMIDPGSVQAPKSWGDRSGSFSATEVFIYEP
ncbi:hypothetical protein MUU55_11400 [Shinella curvata]|nr:hypothetical protein [Shinella curvata]